MSEIKIGEMRAYLTRGGRKFDKIGRERSENRLQSIIDKNREKIFGKKIHWLRQKGTYGDMFGIAENAHLVVVEIKGPKSTGKKSTGYGLAQLKRRFRKIEDVVGSKNKFLDVCKKLKIENPKKLIKKKLGIELTRLDYQPEFYFFSTQFQKELIEKVIKTRKDKWIKRWRPNIHCINLNLFKRGKKEILVMTRFV